MPITVTCNECSESHRVKDDAVGKRFKCKGCGKSLVVVASPPPEDDFSNFDEADFADDETDDADGDDRPKVPKRKAAPKKSAKEKPGKSKPVSIHRTKVPLGIDCVYFGAVLMLLLVLIAGAVGLSKPVRPPNVNPVVYWLGFGGLAATVLTTAGKLMCLTAPPNMSGRGSIFVAVAIDLLSLSITLAGFFTVVPPLLRGSVNLLALAGFVCFIRFLQHLGDFIGERDLRERGDGVFRLGIGIVVLYIVEIGLAVMALGNALPRVVAGLGILVVTLALLVSLIVFALRYGGLLSACRYALSNA